MRKLEFEPHERGTIVENNQAPLRGLVKAHRYFCCEAQIIRQIGARAERAYPPARVPDLFMMQSAVTPGATRH